MKNSYIIIILLSVFSQRALVAQNKKAVYVNKKMIVNKSLVLAKQQLVNSSKIPDNILPVPTATGVIAAFTPTGQVICIGEAITFTNNSISALTYTWDFGDGGSSTLDNPSYTYTTSGQYTISLTAANGTVQATITDTITVNNPPNADFTIQQIDNCNGTVQFNCVGTFTNSNWGLNGVLEYIENTCETIKVYNKEGFYSVEHSINPGTFCSARLTKSFYVTALNENLGPIPNVISPNFDGVNDYIDFSKYIKCGNFEYEIFDRWGLSILNSNNSKQGIWDGRTTSGKAVTDGTYFYTIKTATQSYKGTINVFR